MVNSKRILEDYLVTSVRLGDQNAMRQLVELRGPRLMAHAMRLLGDPEEASDAVQDSWIDIILGLKNLRDTRAFPAWATCIVTRRCAKVINSKQARRKLHKDVSSVTDGIVEENGTEAAEAAQIRAAIATLPPEQSSAIALFYLEGMNVTEVSMALDVPIGTIKTRLMHAREKLRGALKRS